MAYAAVSIPSYTAASATMDAGKEQSCLRRSSSGKDSSSKLRRSYSDNHLCHARVVEPKLKSSRSMGIFPFQISGSILPGSFRSFLFDPEVSRDMNLEEKEISVAEENSGSGEVKRANWVERLMEIKRHWRNRVPKENMDDQDVVYDGDGCEECDCDGDDGVCMVDYDGEDDDDDDGQEMAYDSEFFSKLLVRVPWCDTKLYSQLAFLCNMAYVIPQIKVSKHISMYYTRGFKFSSTYVISCQIDY